MDERRFRLYVSTIAVLFLFTLGRVLTDTNPIYSALEPVIGWLDEISSDITLTQHETSTPNETLAAKNSLLEDENSQLRKQLNVQEQDDTVNAEVTRRDLLGFRKDVWVGAGKTQGVLVGQTVTVDGSLFGVVEEVFESSARIKTIIDPDFRATVSIGNDHGVMKIEYGSLIVDLVPSKELSGQTIVTDGLDAAVLANVYVGLLGAQVSDNSEVFGSYSVDLPNSIFEARFVDIHLEGGQR